MSQAAPAVYKRVLLKISGEGFCHESGFGIDATELEKRRASLKPVATPEWAKRGYAHLFNETILQADEGCDFDFMRGKGKG